MLYYYYGSILWGYRSHIPWLSTSWNLTGNDNVNLPKLGWGGVVIEIPGFFPLDAVNVLVLMYSFGRTRITCHYRSVSQDEYRVGVCKYKKKFWAAVGTLHVGKWVRQFVTFEIILLMPLSQSSTT